jgi:branched-chain amino acid transport system substrate-binding protein
MIGIALGPGECDAVRLAIADAVQAGRWQGIDTAFIVATNTRAAPAIQAAEQFIGRSGLIAVVGHGNSAASLAAAPVYNDNEVIQLSPNSTAVLYSNAGPFSFRMVSPDDRQGKFLGERVLAEARGKRVALMYVNDDYGRGLRAEVHRAIPPGAVEWVMDTPHIEGGADLTSRVAVLAYARPDVIVWLGRGLELEKMLPQIRERLGTVPIFGGDGVATTALRATDASWDGVHVVDLLDLDANDAMRALRQRYASRFGRMPTAAEILAYDAMSLIIAGVHSGARTGPQLQTFMNGLGREHPVFEGVAGPVVFDANGDVARDYVLFTAKPAS